MLAATALPQRDPMCLEEDEEGDEPLACDGHYREQIYVYTVLYERLTGPDCYVSFQRWLRRDPKGQRPPLQPDILVAFGVPDALRRVYDPWEHGRPPTMVAEWLSESSLTADRELKPEEYRKLGIGEYWLFNPHGEFHDPRIQGWDLQAAGGSAPFPPAEDGGVPSRVLPVRFAVREALLEVLDAATGEPLTPWRAQEVRIREETAAREQADVARLRADAAREQSDAARRQLEEEVARLRAELRQLRGERGDKE